MAHLVVHHLGRLVVASHRIGQTGIGVSGYIIRYTLSQCTQAGQHIVSPKGAVESNAEQGSMGHADDKSLQNLPTQNTSSLIDDCHAEHQGNLNARLFLCNLESTNGSLSVERIIDSLEQDGIHPTLQEGRNLLYVGSGKLIEGQGSQGRIVDVRTHGKRLVGRPNGRNHKARLLRRGEFISHFSRNAYSSTIDFLHIVLAMIISHADSLCTESISRNDIGSCQKIASMDILNDVRSRKHQNVVVTLHLTRNIAEAVTTKILLSQMIGLNHGTHRSIEPQDTAFLEFRLQRCHAKGINSRIPREQRGTSQCPTCSTPWNPVQQDRLQRLCDNGGPSHESAGT